MLSVAQLRVDAVLDVPRPDSADGVPGDATQVDFPYPWHLRRVVRAAEHVREVERDRTVREDRELAARSAERRRGWEQNWINWERHR